MIEHEKIKAGADIIFYDGLCGLCNKFVQFVLAHQGGLKFLFCSLQSNLAAQLLSEYGVNNSDLNTIFIISQYGLPSGHLLKKSQAVFFILHHCKLPWYVPQFALSILSLLPEFLLNIGYDFIASIRYKLFGRYDSCLIPEKAERDRFIDS